MLAECLADNKVMVRLDLRDNAQIGSAGLLALHLAMKMNTSITLLNLDTSIASSSSSKVSAIFSFFTGRCPGFEKGECTSFSH